MARLPTTPGEIEAAARSVLARAMPRATDHSRIGRPMPAETLPAFTVEIVPTASEPVAMGSDLSLVEGDLRIGVSIALPSEGGADLASLQATVCNMILSADPLDRMFGVFDLSSAEWATSAEGERIARLSASFDVTWVQPRAVLPQILARFGLA